MLKSSDLIKEILDCFGSLIIADNTLVGLFWEMKKMKDCGILADVINVVWIAWGV